MPSSLMATMETRSSLELMLEELQELEDQPKDLPPALPARPVTKARLPRSRRQLALNFQKSDCEENENMGITTSFDGSIFESDKLIYQQPAEKIGVGAPAIVIMSANEAIEGYDCRKNISDIGKISYSDDRNETVLEGIQEIQMHCHGHQTCCNCHELKRGVIALQSFIRGEIARKGYVKSMTAIGVIQKHAKDYLRRRGLDGQNQAVLCLQARIGGWLAWRKLDSLDKKEKQLNEHIRNVINLEKKDPDAKVQIQVPYPVLVDLRRQVLKTEALLDKKKEENASLQLQIKQLGRKRQQYEAKRKSMEKMWQDQLTSTQISLAAAKKSSASKNAKGKLGQLFALPETHDQDSNDASLGTKPQVIGRLNSISHRNGQENEVLDKSDGIFIQVEPGQVASATNLELELRKLELKFKAWKKDFKARLMEAKTTIKELGKSQSVNCQKRWWGR